MTADHPALRRIGAVLGALGVAAFVAGWVVGAALRPAYSPVHQAISQLAREGAPHRWVMTAAFVAYGIGVVALGAAVARGWRRPVLGVVVAVVGLATLAVALFPLSAAGGGAEDHRHVASAVTGYVALAAAPLLGRRAVRLPRLSVVVAVLVAVALALTVPAADTGLWQRLGLTLGDTWLVLLASRLAVDARPGDVQRPQHQRDLQR